MKLTGRWDNLVWEDATVQDVLESHLNISGEHPGHIEALEAKLNALTEVVARLIRHTANNDREALEIIGHWNWELAK